jgi:long-chain acyl-CoA synthetase
MHEVILRSGERILHQTALRTRAAQAAQGLLDLALQPSDAVAMVLRNDFALFETVLASRLAGVTVVPINWHFTRRETRYVLADCGARVLVVHADLLPAMVDGLDEDVTVLVVPTPPEIAHAYAVDATACAVPSGAMAWEDFLSGRGPLQTPRSPAGSNMLYTSGTTGNPKGVRRMPMTAAEVDAYYATLTRAFGLRAGMRHLVTGPLYHSSPYGNAMVGLHLGAEMDLMPRFDPLALLRTIEARRITHMHMVPTMFVRLLRLPVAEREGFDLSSLEVVCHGAAPCPAAVKEAMIAWWGPVFREYYGSTEASVIAGSSCEEWRQRPGSVGRPFPGVRVEIRDDQRNPLPAGEVGEIWARLSSAPQFDYHGRSAERAEIEHGGLLTNGDVGYLDEDGYLYLCDRKRDMIISAGVNIYPAEVEAALLEHPGISDCAVFGVPDAEFGEAVTAAVQLCPGTFVGDAELSAFAAERVARFKVPTRFEYHEQLPRLDNGKIYKRRLREPHWQDSGRQI